MIVKDEIELETNIVTSSIESEKNETADENNNLTPTNQNENKLPAVVTQGEICLHNNTIDDEKSGDNICLSCGLVLDKIFKDSNQKYRAYDAPSYINIREFIYDVCENGTVAKSTAVYAYHYFESIKPLLAPCNFKDKLLASYAIYYALNKHHTPRTPEEVQYFTGCNAADLWHVEGKLSLLDTNNSPLEYVNRFASLLGLSYYDMKCIKHLIMELHDFPSLRPQTVVAVITHLYCKHQKKKISVSQIASVCQVSTTNIYRIKRSFNMEYASTVEAAITNVVTKY